jgi:hypothetical protein
MQIFVNLFYGLVLRSWNPTILENKNKPGRPQPKAKFLIYRKLQYFHPFHEVEYRMMRVGKKSASAANRG